MICRRVLQKNLRAKIASKQEGFSLAELVIVIVVIGFLGVMVARQFGGGVSDTAQANALISMAEKVDESWNTLCSTAGTTKDPTDSNPMIDSVEGSSELAALYVLAEGGRDAITDEYKDSYRQAGLNRMDDLRLDLDSSYSATCEPGGCEYFVQETPMTIEYDASEYPRVMNIKYFDVPINVAQAIWGEFEREEFDSSSLSSNEGERVTVESGSSDTMAHVTIEFSAS